MLRFKGPVTKRFTQLLRLRELYYAGTFTLAISPTTEITMQEMVHAIVHAIVE